MINVIYIPAGRAVWLDVAKELKIAKFDIKIWLGDPKLDDRAKELFPSCNVENFFRVNKGLLGKRKIVHTPSREILLDKKFFVLKDKVYKIMDRQDDIRRFSRLEREAVFYLWFNYYYNIIVDENIKLLVASEAPHSPVGMVLYGLCEILNIPRYHLMQSGVAPLMHVCKDFYGTVVNVCRNEKVASIFKDIYTDYVSSFSSSPEEPLYMINQKKHDIKKERLGIIKYLELFGKGVKYSRKKKQRNSYAINNNFFYEDNSRSVFSQLISNKIHTKLENAYLTNVIPLSLNLDYVYYPLHYEPERTSNPDGGLYYQSYDAIIALRSFIPKNIPIYVKEHYSQFTRMLPGYRGKSPYLYKVLTDIPNVFLVDLNVKSETLVRNALLTVSQTGTACIEAACFERKSILMGDTWFSGIPNVYSFSALQSFEDLMLERNHSREEVLESLLGWIDNKAIPGCVNPSSEEYFRQKFSDAKYAAMFDDKIMVKQYVATIINDLQKCH
ncbi:hypothetical protein EA26_01930 [Vibrio navarrensis]|uniref:Capsule biosynthesis protein n=1 Tax=Vibrio navarrensis TaxID=29495 RepID=A0A099LPT0_9VIBR|nr:hypothetical protein [Vibrio navarrensis]KGK10135.1 hypothetical protein EA26_01930 [Vibrio navarrensis]QOD69883.1 hypothetical protein IF132_14115 [Vibrio navarrensis]